MASGWVIGFDAAFSAPKSVSPPFALGDRELRGQVRSAHVTAVEEAGLEYLEQHAAFTRRGRNGVMVMDTGRIGDRPVRASDEPRVGSAVALALSDLEQGP